MGKALLIIVYLERSLCVLINKEKQMSDFRVEIKVKNANLYNYVYGNYSSISEFSRACGMSQTIIGNLINLKLSPIAKNSGKLRDCAERLCSFFGVLPEELFPEAVAELKLERNNAYFEASSQQMTTLLHNQDPLTALVDQCDSDVMQDILEERLTARELKVINCRYGLADEDEQTLRQIGDKFDVSQERIRQVEQKR